MACKILHLLPGSGYILCFPGGASGREPACQCRRCKRHGFDPWVRKIPWSREWQPTQIFLTGKSHRKRSLSSYSPWGPTVHGVTKSQTWLKWLSMSPEIELRPSAVKVQSPNHWTTRESPKNNSKVMNFQTLKIDKLLEKYKVPDKFKKQVNPK